MDCSILVPWTFYPQYCYGHIWQPSRCELNETLWLKPWLGRGYDAIFITLNKLYNSSLIVYVSKQINSQKSQRWHIDITFYPKLFGLIRIFRQSTISSFKSECGF